MNWVSAVVAAIVGAVKGWFGIGAGPTTADLAAGKATAEAELKQKDAENETLVDTARAAAAADAAILRERAEPPPANVTGATSGLDADPDGHWRD